MIRKIDNLEEYFKNFDLHTFVNRIKITPVPYHQNNIGKDDKWGCNYVFEELLESDSYFTLVNKIELSNNGWSESGYTSGQKQEKEILVNIQSEYDTCLQLEKEVRYKVIERYDRNEHLEFLKLVNSLTTEELSLIKVFQNCKNRIFIIHVIHNGQIRFYDGIIWSDPVSLKLFIDFFENVTIVRFFSNKFSDKEIELRFVDLNNFDPSLKERYYTQFGGLIAQINELKKIHNII